MRLDGLLVAGGRARRFGSDKRRAQLAGAEGPALLARRTLAEQSLALLRACIHGDLFVAGAGAFDHPVGAITVADASVHSGPLGGIAGGLLRTPSGLLVLPCDAPLLRVDTLRAVGAVGLRHARTVVVRSRRGLEPLVGYYPRSALPFLLAALREGSRALHRLLPRLGALEVPAGDSREMHNVNRPQDLVVARQLAGTARAQE